MNCKNKKLWCLQLVVSVTVTFKLVSDVLALFTADAPQSRNSKTTRIGTAIPIARILERSPWNTGMLPKGSYTWPLDNK